MVRAVRQALETTTPNAALQLSFKGERLRLSAPSSPSGATHLTDVEAFEAAAAQAQREGSVRTYRTAIALYTGDLLPEDRYAEWAIVQRAALSSRFIDLLLGLARTLETQQKYAEANEALRRVVRIEPAHEESRLGLMRLYALRGTPLEAEREYQALVAALAEIGARPGSLTQQVRADIQSGRLVAPDPGVSHLALLSQVSDESSNTSESSAAITNLPFDTSRFIGRSREVAEIVGLLGESRLVTITGAGGGGKTRLAVHIAQSLVGSFRDGVWLVELAALAQPSLLAQKVAAALRTPERADIPALETLISALGGKQLVLVLDNCEHLLDACAQLVETLLRRCRDLRVLCTSREPLHIPGEVVWRIAALSLPEPRRLPYPPAQADIERLAHCESMELFLDRARAATPSFALTASNAQTVAQICRRLDGLPLAIELAAALVGSLPLEQIVTRLDSCFDLLVFGSRTALTRQQTLRGALDWSYDLLLENDQVVFRRLAVFAGDFTLAAAQSVTSFDGVQGAGQWSQTWMYLSHLVDKSLVVADTSGVETRYHLLEPVRQYAERRLAEAGEIHAVRLRHAQWFAQLCEQADAELWGTEHEAALAQLEANRANVRAALGWWLRNPSTAEEGLRHARSLWQFWLLRGAFAEGRGWLERLSALAPGNSRERSDALMCAVGLAIRQGEYGSDQTGAMTQESVDNYRALGDLVGAGRAGRLEGMLAHLKGQVETAETAFMETQRLAQTRGEPGGEALALHALGMLAWLQGDYGKAHDFLSRSLQEARQAGNRECVTIALMNPPKMPFTATSGLLDLVYEETCILLRSFDLQGIQAYTLAHLGSLARCQGDFASARDFQMEARHRFEQIGDHEGMAQVAGHLGNLARVEGDYSTARVHLHESLRLRRTLGDRRGMFIALNNLGLLAVAEGQYARADELYTRGFAYATQYGDGSALQMTIYLQAHLAVIRGDIRQARQLYQRLSALMAKTVVSTYDDAHVQARLGNLALKQGDVASAHTFYTKSLAHFERICDQGASAAIRTILAGTLVPSLPDD